jgi:glutathione S-transferase
MIIVHHLNESRSQRILWALEEMGLDYEVVTYARDPKTRLAPPELKRIHPLGKSPVVEADGRVLAESGAILEYLAETRGSPLAVPAGAPERETYLHWMHYAEGSAMVPFLLMVYVGRLGEAGAPLHPRIFSEIENHLSYVESAYRGRDFLVGDRLTAADIQMSFILDAAQMGGRLAAFPEIARARQAMHLRPAYQRALERGGRYAMGD